MSDKMTTLPTPPRIRMRILASGIMASLLLLPGRLDAREPDAAPGADGIGMIKSYSLDFNWGEWRRFAEPGRWSGADPAEHVAWYKAMGANVIQTFAVSCNGYAWYKNGVVPEQPGLEHDFLPEVVRLGQKEGMLVFGYFCIAANTRWGNENPDYSYGTPADYHIPYTDAYLAYLAAAIEDAVGRTGIDGFMVDWLWQPKRLSTDGKWLASEKALYEQLMGEAFPGEDHLTPEQDLAYSRKAIDRTWKTIRAAARRANPECIIWVTVNNIRHPHVVDSDMYQEADWLMNEAGDMQGIEAVKPMVGEHTRLITCLAHWNRQDATRVVPQALEAGVGLYGFTRPRTDCGIVPLEPILARPVNELRGDDRNIAALARAFHNLPMEAVWTADPEVGIGHHLGQALDAPVLMVKACIGNRALGWDLLPPGSERFEFGGKIHAGYRDSYSNVQGPWEKGPEPAEPDHE